MVPKILVTTDLSADCLTTMRRLKGSPLLDDKEIHLLHVFETIYYNFDLSTIIYPRADEKPKIEENVMDTLIALKNHITPLGHKPQVVLKCLFELEAKETIVKYAKEIGAELLVVATQGKKGIPGLFHSSFAQYMCKHAPCDLMVLRPLL